MQGFNIDNNELLLAMEKERILKSKDHYETLGVPKGATEVQIKQQYKKLCLLLHPDKREGSIGNEFFQKIKVAHSVLIDPEERTLYDKQIDNEILNPPKYPFNTQEAPCGSCQKLVHLYANPFPFFCPHCKKMTNLFPPPNYSHTTYNFGSATLAYQAAEVELTPIFPAFIPRRKRGRIPKNLKLDGSEEKKTKSVTKKEKKKRRSKKNKIEEKNHDNEEDTCQKDKFPRKSKKKKEKSTNLEKRTLHDGFVPELSESAEEVIN